MNIFIVYLFPLSLLVFPLTISASAMKAQPGQTSTTCYYNVGPKVGQEENLSGQIKPLLIGKPCTDGEGSSGSAVMDQEDEERAEAEAAAKSAAKYGKPALTPHIPESN
jgi:hypothetical protein